MKYKTSKLAIWAAKTCSVIMWNEFRYPQPVKGRYNITGSKLEKLKWAYRCWVKQIEVAEKNSGIEAYFKKQDLNFKLPPGFERMNKITISAGGDLMAVDCLTPQSCRHFFDRVKDFYFTADLTCANLESTITSEGPIGRNQVIGYPPKMNTCEDMMDIFQDGGRGIDYYSTANNHCYDYGEQGLLDTLECLDKRNVYYSGTNRSKQDQEDVLVVEKNGIKIAMLSYTCDMNGNEYDKKHLINEVRFNDENVDLSLVQRHINKAREKSADIIVAYIHWGWEFEMYPHKNIIQAAKKICDMGVDIILGSHPHVSQPMENYRTIDGRNCLIIYSLGDFVSYHPLSKNSKLTYIVRLDIEKGKLKGDLKTFATNLLIKPVYIFCENLGGDNYDCRLIPFKEVLEDNKSDGNYQYKLTDEERKDLSRLKSKVWDKILMPEKTGNIIKY